MEYVQFFQLYEWVSVLPENVQGMGEKLSLTFICISIIKEDRQNQICSQLHVCRILITVLALLLSYGQKHAVYLVERANQSLFSLDMA